MSIGSWPWQVSWAQVPLTLFSRPWCTIRQAQPTRSPPSRVSILSWISPFRPKKILQNWEKTPTRQIDPILPKYSPLFTVPDISGGIHGSNVDAEMLTSGKQACHVTTRHAADSFYTPSLPMFVCKRSCVDWLLVRQAVVNPRIFACEWGVVVCVYICVCVCVRVSASVSLCLSICSQVCLACLGVSVSGCVSQKMARFMVTSVQNHWSFHHPEPTPMCVFLQQNVHTNSLAKNVHGVNPFTS